MSKDDDERFWNLLTYKVYATDEEMWEIMPLVVFFIGIIIVGALCFGWLMTDNSKTNTSPSNNVTVNVTSQVQLEREDK